MAEKHKLSSAEGDVEENLKRPKLGTEIEKEKNECTAEVLQSPCVNKDKLIEEMGINEACVFKASCENENSDKSEISLNSDDTKRELSCGNHDEMHKTESEAAMGTVSSKEKSIKEVKQDSDAVSGSGEPSLLDPLSYTKAEEFTSEIFKIQIHNLPKFGFSELKKRLKSCLHLNPHKLKSDKRYVTYVCFRNEADRDEALERINGHIWKGKTLQAKIAAPVADPYLQKRQEEQGSTEDTVKHKAGQAVREQDMHLTPEEAQSKLRANVSPLWNVEYSEQLQMKSEKIKDVLERVTKHNFVKHMFTDKTKHNGLACELLPIVPSPVTSEYRNKNEFTVGYSLDGKTVQVGFRYGMYKDGTTAVGDCTNLGIAMPAAIPVVKSFNDFVSKSQWLPFRQETATGHWQTLTVRTFHTGDVMAMIDFVPRKLEQLEIDSAKASVKEYYTSGDGKDVNIKSFYFRVMSGKGHNVKPGSELLFGEPHVYEQLLGLKFRISPEAFFQVNTAATGKLYELIADWSSASPTTTVLDICCGTGTIGLSMAKKVKDVIGIEMCEPAVKDARVNASINGITNATFHCAKVENVISKIMSSIQSSSERTDDIVAVVDPPRAGLHKDVIKTLRRCSEIQRLVYVSCNPDSALDNFVDLIRPETGRHKGSPFTMIKAIPVDLFPGTRHCELVILFARSNSNALIHGDDETKTEEGNVQDSAESNQENNEK